MNSKEESYLDESVAAHVAMLNNLTDYYKYTIPEKNHKGKDLFGTEIHETHPGGLFHVYDRWSFLDRSAQIIEHYLNKGFIKKIEIANKAA